MTLRMFQRYPKFSLNLGRVTRSHPCPRSGQKVQLEERGVHFQTEEGFVVTEGMSFVIKKKEGKFYLNIVEPWCICRRIWRVEVSFQKRKCQRNNLLR